MGAGRWSTGTRCGWAGRGRRYSGLAYPALRGANQLVNAAGVAPNVPIERTTEDILEQCFLVNAFGPAFLISRCWPHFKRQKSGCVVNVSTLGVMDPFPGFFAYAASKAALDSFTRSVAREGRSSGIRSFCVNPGAVETAILREWPSKREALHAKGII